MTFPSIRLRVALASDPLDSTPTFEDMSTRVKEFTFDYGKQSALDEFQPGTSSVLLENGDRMLDPLFTGSLFPGTDVYPSESLFPGGPLANLIPRRRCVLDATYIGVTYDQFTTFNNGWPQTYQPPQGADVHLSGSDLFVLLTNIDLPASVWRLEVAADSPLAWYKLGETTGTVAFDTVKSHNGVYNYNIDRLTTDGLVAFDPDKAIDVVPLLDKGTNSLSIPVSTVPVGIYDLDAVPSSVPVVIEVVARPRQPASAYGSASAGMYLFRSSRPTMEVNFSLNWIDAAPDAQLRASWSPIAANGRSIDSTANFPFNATYLFAAKFDTGVEELWVNGANVAGSTSAVFGYSNIKDAAAIGGQYPDKSIYIFTGTLDEVLIFNKALSSARLAAHGNAALTPWIGDKTGARLQRIATYCGLEAADVAFGTGSTILGATALGGNALSYMQSIALTEDGALYVEHRNGGKLTFNDRYTRWTATRSTTSQATFTDDPAAGAGAYRFEPDNLALTDDESQIVNEAVVQWDQGELRASNAASILAHGRKSRTYSTRLKTAVEAQSYAEWQVALYKDRHVRIASLTLNPAADATVWIPALSLRYGDRVTFRFLPQNTGTAIAGDYWVQGIHVEASQGVNAWLTTFYLTPAHDVQVFILDSSLLDGTDLLAS